MFTLQKNYIDINNKLCIEYIPRLNNLSVLLVLNISFYLLQKLSNDCAELVLGIT